MPEFGLMIVPAQDEDAPAMAELLRISTYGLIDAILGGRSAAPWFADPGSRHRRGACLKAVVAGRIIGHAVAFAATPAPDDPAIPPLPGEEGRRILDRIRAASRPGSWYLSSLAVVPDFRRSGAGRALALAALEAGEARGFDEASLHVFDGNLPAVSFYRTLGFEPTGRVELPEPRDPMVRGSGQLVAMAAPLVRVMSEKKIMPL